MKSGRDQSFVISGVDRLLTHKPISQRQLCLALDPPFVEG